MSQGADLPAGVSLADVKAARERIGAEILRTPCIFSEAPTARAGRPVHLKLENLQLTGAFKVRGALNKVMSLAPENRQRGVICASTGNHGLGVAYAASRSGITCIVVLPENANPHKMTLLKKLGAEVVCYGETSDVTHRKATELSQERGLAMVHPFADPQLIAGQGTVGLEVLEDVADVDDVYVGIGGGGLISGVAVAIKEQRPQTRIWGVQPTGANSMGAALRAGKTVAIDKVQTVADGLSARITQEINLSLVQRYVEDVIVVSDEAIVESLYFLLEHAKVLAEPSGAASFAGLLANPARGGRSVAVVSGGNVNLRQLEELRKFLGN